MDILIYVLGALAVGYVWGWMAHTKTMLERLLKDPDEFFKKLMEYRNMIVEHNEQPKEPSTREIHVDHENGIFYLYAKDNGQFLSQGSTLEQALEILAERFPGQKFQGLIPAEEAKRLGLS